MSKLRSLALLATAALLSLFAVPAGAAAPSARASVSQDTFKGTAAVAQWVGGMDVVGEPHAFFIGGFDATVVSHVAGSKPARTPQPSLVAMAMWLQDPGGEPYLAEVWGLPEEWSFNIDSELTAATLSFDCDAMILTSEEGPPSGTLPLSVEVTWTGVGPLLTEKSHSRQSDDTGWWIDRIRSKVRMATAEVAITGPGGIVYFDGEVSGDTGEVDMFTAKQGHLFHATTIM